MSLSSPIEVSDTEGVKWAKLQRIFRAIADAAGITYSMSGFLTDIEPRETEGVKWAKLGAWAQLIASNTGGLPPASSLQKGVMPLVVGQQSYVIVFPVAFAAAPSYFDAPVQMVNSTGEVFTAEPDLTTLTAAGVTVWLSGIPTGASTGSRINWLAIL